MYPGLPDGPVPLGGECSGRITAVGEGVTDLRVGDEVLAVAGFAFGSHAVTRAELVAKKPPRAQLRGGRHAADRVSHRVVRARIAGPARAPERAC